MYQRCIKPPAPTGSRRCQPVPRRRANKQVRATARTPADAPDALATPLQAGGRGFESHRLHRERVIACFAVVNAERGIQPEPGSPSSAPRSGNDLYTVDQIEQGSTTWPLIPRRREAEEGEVSTRPERARCSVSADDGRRRRRCLSGGPTVEDEARRSTRPRCGVLQGELVAMQEWVKATGRQGLRRVRGPGHGRQGRHDQADHRADEPAGVPARRAAGADRAREVADVRAALHRPLPGRGRGRDLRPQLVQPRRCRAGHGLLHRRSRPSGSSRWCRRSRRRWSTPGSS